MTAQERKENSERILSTLGISLRDDLPPIEEESAIELRSGQNIAQRILILTYLNCVAHDPSLQQEVMIFLIREKLWEHATERERELFHKTQLNEEELTEILWRVESIWLLLWSIKKVEVLTIPREEVNLDAIFPLLPGFFESTDDFIQSASVRTVSEILDQADFYFRLNWALRQAEKEGSPIATINPSVAYERYFSTNWITRARLRWDEY
jgi:hypothetical protein